MANMEPAEAKSPEIEMTPERFHETFHRVRKEIGKVVVGQETAVWHRV